MTPRRRVAWVGMFLLNTLSPACGGRGKSDALASIPECTAYERAVSACTGRKIALQPAEILPGSATLADREHLRNLCVTNLQRVRNACR